MLKKKVLRMMVEVNKEKTMKFNIKGVWICTAGLHKITNENTESPGKMEGRLLKIESIKGGTLTAKYQYYNNAYESTFRGNWVRGIKLYHGKFTAENLSSINHGTGTIKLLENGTLIDSLIEADFKLNKYKYLYYERNS